MHKKCSASRSLPLQCMYEQSEFEQERPLTRWETLRHKLFSIHKYMDRIRAGTSYDILLANAKPFAMKSWSCVNIILDRIWAGTSYGILLADEMPLAMNSWACMNRHNSSRNLMWRLTGRWETFRHDIMNVITMMPQGQGWGYVRYLMTRASFCLNFGG